MEYTMLAFKKQLETYLTPFEGDMFKWNEFFLLMEVGFSSCVVIQVNAFKANACSRTYLVWLTSTGA